MAAALADRLGQSSLAAPEFLHQPAIGFRLFQRRQILTLQILDEGDFQRLGVGQWPDHYRHFVQPRPLRCPPAPLPGDQLEIGARPVHGVLGRPHQQGLDDALVADRLGEPFQLLLAEMAARLKRRRADRLDRHRAGAAEIGKRPCSGLAEQRRETAPERGSLRPRDHCLAHAGAPAGGFGADCRSSSAASCK